MTSLRQILPYLLPSWARDDEADGAMAYTFAALIDISMQRLRSGLEARFPSRAGEAALALIGRDRLILRGRDETAAHYAARLKAWRNPRGHRVRGSVFALLEQISEYFGGGFELWGIDRSGNKRTMGADGALSYSYGNTWTWDTGAASAWARQWVVVDGSTLFRAQPDLGDTDLWGGAFGTDGYCIGILGSSAQDWRAIRRLTVGQHRWLPAGTQGEWLVVSLDGSAPVPDSAWGKWGEIDGDTYIPARSADFRYVGLRATLRDYAGDTDWASEVITPAWTIDGDDTIFPALITLPGGSAYAGDVTDFPATITLPDDGDIPR